MGDLYLATVLLMAAANGGPPHSPLAMRGLQKPLQSPSALPPASKGRLLVEEMSCTACHAAEDTDARGLRNRLGPDLSKVGSRVKEAWLNDWLRHPQAVFPKATMPRLFAEGPTGDVEIHAVGRYLASLGGPVRDLVENLRPNEVRTSTARGERLYHRVGCAVCHGQMGDANQAIYPLRSLGAKTAPGPLARYLLDPLAADPSGRMPGMGLNLREAQDIARFLCGGTAGETTSAGTTPKADSALKVFQLYEKRAAERAAFAAMPERERWLTLGQRLVMEKRCNSCHTIAPNNRPFAQILAKTGFADVRKRASGARMNKQEMPGCLAPMPPAAVPRFNLSLEERTAIQMFLARGEDRGHLAPTYQLKLDLDRFHCTVCHQLDGQGGLSQEMLELLKTVETAQDAEAISPPPLTGVGAKLRQSWLEQVLSKGARARPWMGLRMPEFGAKNVGHLAASFVAVAGEDPKDKNDAPRFDRGMVEVGRALVGKKGFGCISCHDIAGVPASGTRGPDLASMQERVRYSWYRRWLEQPQRMQPGTRMPTIFPDGRSLIDDVLGGQADAQAAAMWHYLSLGKNLPLPEGLEPPPGLIVTVKDRPVILRTFMPGAGARAIAVGYPEQVSVAYDSAACRLAYAWSGNFLDASPAWNDRGGNPARLLGPRFWESPAGFPWAFTEEAAEPPDFRAQSGDPAFGAEPPPGTLATERRLFFRGYSCDSAGRPELRAEVKVATDWVRVREQIEPVRRPEAVGLVRRFYGEAPRNLTAWFQAGESSAEPKVVKAGSTIADLTVVLRRQEGGAILTRVLDAPAGAEWRFVQKQGGWLALVRLPKQGEARFHLGIAQLHPHREESIELLAKEKLQP